MANKQIWIGGTRIGYATKAEVTPKIEGAEETATFDGNIMDTAESISWEVSIDKIRYDKTIQSYKQVEVLLLSMINTKKTVRIIEGSTVQDGDKLIVMNDIYECVLTDKKYTINPTERTVENISFKGTSMKEWINNEQVYP